MCVIILENIAGTRIQTAIAVAIKRAETASDGVQFEFNGVTVRVHGGSNPELVYRDWDRGLKGYLGEKPTVGLYLSETLTAAELASDAQIEQANELRRQADNAVYRAKEAVKQQTLEGILQVAGPLELSDPEGFAECLAANSSDPYSRATVDYAENWGRCMQKRMRDGLPLETIADECSHIADIGGITGAMYGFAVSILARCWTHGEQLRRWHNKDTQLGTEGDVANESGGVLNPAMLCVGKN